MNCPQCGKPVEWGAGSPHRPFCSARCRQIDLGAWATDAYRITGSESDGEPDELRQGPQD